MIPKKQYYFSLLFLCIVGLCSCNQHNNNTFNLNFENIDKTFHPIGWNVNFFQKDSLIEIKVDSKIKQEGKYSLCLSNSGNNNKYIFFSKVIKAPSAGTKISFTGFLKSKSVENGYGGLWMRIEDENGKAIGIGDEQTKGIIGTNEWKEYGINIDYLPNRAKKIIIGAFLTGKGKIWVDNLHLTIDGEPIEYLSRIDSLPQNDTSAKLDLGSGILPFKLNIEKVNQLSYLGKIWGFLKYYHPAIAKGEYNWDAELFRILPKIIASNNMAEANNDFEQWVDNLGTVNICKNCDTIPKNTIVFLPDFDGLFPKNYLAKSLINKLKGIRNNHNNISNNYYISDSTASGNPVFLHEITYENVTYPDTGIRLLALFRYWNMIEYFYPYKNLIIKDWDNVLVEFIPKFINAKNKEEYILACLELIGKLHDTHANIWKDRASILDSLKGAYITPFQAKFIERKLVVTGYYTNNTEVKENIKIGDIIEKIDGISVDSLVKKFLSLTPASNFETQLRDLPSVNGFLLRSNNKTTNLVIRKLDGLNKITINKILCIDAKKEIVELENHEIKGYKFLNNSIGYIYPAKLKQADIDSIKVLFKNTKGVIIDLRCYPSIFMPYSFGSWLKASSAFALATKVSLLKPGTIVYKETLYNGGSFSDYYKGKVVIIVNSSTQSQSEFTAMALSAVPNSIIVGSTTAGADGDVSPIILPGGILTMISGLGIYYPNFTETQRVGIKINIPIKPTVKGIRNGVDEQLEEAIKLIK